LQTSEAPPCFFIGTTIVLLFSEEAVICRPIIISGTSRSFNIEYLFALFQRHKLTPELKFLQCFRHKEKIILREPRSTFNNLNLIAT
jgi:hypothetical protein